MSQVACDLKLAYCWAPGISPCTSLLIWWLIIQQSCFQLHTPELQRAHLQLSKMLSAYISNRKLKSLSGLAGVGERPGMKAENQPGRGVFSSVPTRLPEKHGRGYVSRSWKKDPYPLFRYRGCSAIPKPISKQRRTGSTCSHLKIKRRENAFRNLPWRTLLLRRQANFRRARPAFRLLLGWNRHVFPEAKRRSRLQGIPAKGGERRRQR